MKLEKLYNKHNIIDRSTKADINEYYKASENEVGIMFKDIFKDSPLYSIYITEIIMDYETLLEIISKYYSNIELVAHDLRSYLPSPEIEELESQFGIQIEEKQVIDDINIYLDKDANSTIESILKSEMSNNGEKMNTIIKIDYDNNSNLSIRIASSHKIEHASILSDMKKNNIELNNPKNIYIVCQDSNGLYLENYSIDNKYKNLDIELNYNDEMVELSEKIISSINDNSSGLYLLHGKHGTGKTTYIRHLIRNVNKKMIFIPPSLTSQLSSPAMLPFLMQHPNSVLIIEDAEKAIEKRENSYDASTVSSILNISDGILGDCLKFQIICTFNTSKSNIDEAIRRKGRLTLEYEFEDLTIEKTKALLDSLNIEYNNEEVEPMSVSEIYNYHLDNNYDNGDSLKGIGFGH